MTWVIFCSFFLIGKRQNGHDVKDKIFKTNILIFEERKKKD